MLDPSRDSIHAGSLLPKPPRVQLAHTCTKSTRMRHTADISVSNFESNDICRALTSGSQTDDRATSHVLAAVITDALYHRISHTVPHRKPLSTAAIDEQASSRRAVQACVTYQAGHRRLQPIAVRIICFGFQTRSHYNFIIPPPVVLFPWQQNSSSGQIWHTRRLHRRKLYCRFREINWGPLDPDTALGHHCLNDWVSKKPEPQSVELSVHSRRYSVLEAAL
jgi:hypothetical protein